ncbi:dienelactone hydrolase family protein [Blastococcus sp. SYSU DS0510]
MAELVLFHHAQGLTAGVRAFADDLRADGHVVHTPDLYDGRTFATLEDGVAHARELGFGAVLERGRAAVAELPERLVYAGFSLGVMPAQLLAQTRPGAAGAVLMHAAVPLGEFADEWPEGVPVQFHVMEADEWGDVAEARELAAAIGDAELFLYPGDRHLFTDRSLADHVEAAAAQVLDRVRAFLAARA